MRLTLPSLACGRPWLDVAIKVVRLVRVACEGLEAAQLHDPSDVHHQYALRCAIYYVLEYGLEEFRTRYNLHNVPGPRGVPRPPTPRHTARRTPHAARRTPRRSVTGCYPARAGGVPHLRRQRRTRPTTAPAPTFFDNGTDWAASYSAATGLAHHNEDHFVEAYSYEILRLLPLHAAVPLPTAERCWKDVKLHRGARGEFRQLHAAAVQASRARATAASIDALERACMQARGSRQVSED